jgi:hypothetical protein
MTSSSATEKSVRFSDRDLILSTPEPRLPPPPHSAAKATPNDHGRWPFIRPYLHQGYHSHDSGASCSDVSSGRTKELGQPKVKSILKTDGFKSCPDVTSFMLDNDDGTLV